ncbi:MAG: FkbM family methyltransferase [Sphingomicrobium sp.]
MNLLTGVLLNFKDISRFGPSILARHLARFRKDRVARVHVPRIGAVAIRAGDSDIETLRETFVMRRYDFAGSNPVNQRVHARYRSVLANGGKPIIVDAGANIGAVSLSFAAQFPDASIVAIEPHPANAALLRRNLEQHGNCVVLEAAIGAERGFVSLHNESYSWGIRTERAASGVPMITIEDAFRASGGDTPLIVKIDIEGFERDLFASNTGWIEQSYVVGIEPHDWMLPGELSSRSFQQAMSRHPFELIIDGDNLLYVRI